MLVISSQPEDYEQHDELVLLLLSIVHLVHGVDKAACESRQDHAWQQLQQEAVEPHVQAE